LEKAILISKICHLKYADTGYGRLYFGNEFCQRLLPSLSDLRRAVNFADQKCMGFSLVTPYVTNDGLLALKPLLKLLKHIKPQSEIVINDWGVLNFINREYPCFEPVLGRLLTKQKRCPTLVRLLKRTPSATLIRNIDNQKKDYFVFQKNIPGALDAYYKGSNVSSVPIIHSFLLTRRIKRIEIDNLAHGLYLELPKEKISASVYFPYVYITTTFFCPTAGCDKNKKSLLKYKLCDKTCQRYSFTLRHSSMPKLVFLKGNTQFYKNSKLFIRKFSKMGINRLVYEPEIPI